MGDDELLGAIEGEANKAPLVPNDENMTELHELVLQQVSLEQEVKTLEDSLKDKKDSLRSVQEDLLPSKMAQLGFQKFTTDDGFNITVKDKMSASISAANAGEAHAWLRSHGFGDLIKNEVTVKFPKGKEAAALEVMEAMDSAGHTAVRKEAVHSSTLKAFVMEQMERGTTLPPSISTYPYSSATIKKPS